MTQDSLGVLVEKAASIDDVVSGLVGLCSLDNFQGKEALRNFLDLALYVAKEVYEETDEPLQLDPYGLYSIRVHTTSQGTYTPGVKLNVYTVNRRLTEKQVDAYLMKDVDWPDDVDVEGEICRPDVQCYVKQRKGNYCVITGEVQSLLCRQNEAFENKPVENQLWKQALYGLIDSYINHALLFTPTACILYILEVKEKKAYSEMDPPEQFLYTNKEVYTFAFNESFGVGNFLALFKRIVDIFLKYSKPVN